jgi:hypothetical protein
MNFSRRNDKHSWCEARESKTDPRFSLELWLGGREEFALPREDRYSTTVALGLKASST